MLLNLGTRNTFSVTIKFFEIKKYFFFLSYKIKYLTKSLILASTWLIKEFCYG